jgi:hypothetical protein
MDIIEEDQQYILKYIENIDNQVACEALRSNMSNEAMTFTVKIIEAFMNGSKT